MTNSAVLAVAGARKTERVIEAALASPDRHQLITTYTNENLRQLERRIVAKNGSLPSNIHLVGWFTFLLSHGIRPYQHSVIGEIGAVRGLNFKGAHSLYAKRGTRAYYLDSHDAVYRDSAADFVALANENSAGAVIRRIESVFDDIYIDEVQDLVGYDLEVIDLLLRSDANVFLVGDPRQHTLSTNLGSKNKKYRGAGFADWLGERSEYCNTTVETTSHRCNKAICDLASSVFPDLPQLTPATEQEEAAHSGVFVVSPIEVLEYWEAHQPVVLRHAHNTNTFGLPAMNIGVAKGSTFDHVLIFPTAPMKKFLEDGDASKLKAPERLYVAITRARHSVAFVV